MRCIRKDEALLIQLNVPFAVAGFWLMYLFGDAMPIATALTSSHGGASPEVGSHTMHIHGLHVEGRWQLRVRRWSEDSR